MLVYQRVYHHWNQSMDLFRGWKPIHWQHWGMPDLLVSGGHRRLRSNCAKWHESLSWWRLRWIYATAGWLSGGHHVPYSGAVHGVFQDDLRKTMRHQLLSCFTLKHILLVTGKGSRQRFSLSTCLFFQHDLSTKEFSVYVLKLLEWFLFFLGLRNQFQASRCYSHISWWKACPLQLWVASPCFFFQIGTVDCPVIRAAGHTWASTWLPICPSTSHWPGGYWCPSFAEQFFVCFKPVFQLVNPTREF